MHELAARVVATGALVCPDDERLLELDDAALRCARCARRFPFERPGVIELLPTNPTPLQGAAPAPYVQSYLQEFARPFVEDPDAVGWGAPERIPSAIAARRFRQADWVVGLLAGQPPHTAHRPDTRNPSNTSPTLATSRTSRVFCDVSGGAGYYSFAARTRFEIVLHCDLSVDSLNYAARRASALGADNMLFLRTDYFRLPFRRSIDWVVCCDTLFGGERHEHLLLESIHGALRPDGLAVVDFHNWWHNPLRRMGVLPQNFGENRSYSRSETARVLRAAGIREFEYFPYHQEVDAQGVLGRILSRIIPPTRLTYRLSGIRRNDR